VIKRQVVRAKGRIQELPSAIVTMINMLPGS
jgi:hypothetical protein